MRKMIAIFLGAALLLFALPAKAGNVVLWQKESSAVSSTEFVSSMRSLGFVDGYNIRPEDFAEWMYKEVKSLDDFESWPKDWKKKGFYINEVMRANGWLDNSGRPIERITVGQLYEVAKSGNLFMPLPGVSPGIPAEESDEYDRSPRTVVSKNESVPASPEYGPRVVTPRVLKSVE